MQLLASEEYGLRCLLQIAERADSGSQTQRAGATVAIAVLPTSASGSHDPDSATSDSTASDSGGSDSARPVSIQAVAEAEGLSAEYTAKLLRTLRLGGLVTSTRGAAGGYRLARPADRISVWDAVEVLGGELFPEHFCRCHPGQRADCVRSTSCTLRPLWSSLARQVRHQLERVSLADLCRNAGGMASGLSTISTTEDISWRA